MKNLILIISTVLFSCSAVQKGNVSSNIPGEVTVKMFKDNSLHEKAIIYGYVYSKHDSCFVNKAVINIDKRLKVGTFTNKNGYFECEVNDGIYSIECINVGNTSEIAENINIKNGYKVFILFELGTRIMFDK